MNQSFYVVDMPTQDMIKDQLPVEDIVAVTQFQTCIACGASIESLTIVDIDQHVEEDEIISMIYAIAVVNGLSFKIILHATNPDLLKSALTYSSNVESKNRVMKYIRDQME